MEVKLFLKLFILFIKNKFINLNEKLNLEGVLLSVPNQFITENIGFGKST